MITLREQTLFVIEDPDFCKEVSQMIGTEWRGQQSEMLSNGSYVEVVLPDEEWNVVWDESGEEKDAETWIEEWIVSDYPDERFHFEKVRRGPGYGHMMQYLHNKGHLPAGHYLVKVWW